MPSCRLLSPWNALLCLLLCILLPPVTTHPHTLWCMTESVWSCFWIWLRFLPLCGVPRPLQCHHTVLCTSVLTLLILHRSDAHMSLCPTWEVPWGWRQFFNFSTSSSWLLLDTVNWRMKEERKKSIYERCIVSQHKEKKIQIMNGRLNRWKPERQTNIHTQGKTSVYHLLVNLELLQRIKYYFSVFNVLDLINEYCATIQMTVKCLGSQTRNLKKQNSWNRPPGQMKYFWGLI